LLLLWRDKPAMFWVLIFPLIMALFFGSIFSGGGKTAAMSIAVIDNDQSKNSQIFIQELKISEALKVARKVFPSLDGVWTFIKQETYSR